MEAEYQERETRLQAQSVHWVRMSKGMWERMSVMTSVGRGISRAGDSIVSAEETEEAGEYGRRGSLSCGISTFH